MRIVQVKEIEKNIQHVKDLFREYANSLNFDLSFQNFEDELNNLPGKYSPPGGCILLAIYNKKVSGCAALRPLNGDICEMKRLYVKPEFRGLGIGKKLAQAIIEKGKTLNYKYMRLDTVEFMKEAVKLYKSLGFYEIEPYIYNPINEARYMELKLLDD